jgi:hypothetical protein
MINIENFSFKITKSNDDGMIKLWARFKGCDGVWQNIAIHLPPTFKDMYLGDTSVYLKDVLLSNIVSFVSSNDHKLLNEIEKQLGEINND